MTFMFITFANICFITNPSTKDEINRTFPVFSFKFESKRRYFDANQRIIFLKVKLKQTKLHTT